jgi:AcrR family transcriptional regulator
LFCRQGVAETSLRDIARGAAVANGTLHYYFPSKAELVHALMDEALRPLGLQGRKILQRGGHPLDLLREMVGFVYRAFDDDWDLYATVLIHGEQIRLAQPKDFPTWSGALTELVQNGQRQGLIRPGDPVFLGLLCHGIHIRIPRGRLSGEIQPPLSQHVDAVAEACWRVLKPDA